MKESILKDKLKEFQLFIMENKYSRGLTSDSKNDEDRKKGEAILKDFFNGMVEGKPITKAIEILEYIKEHKREKTRLKIGDNEERFGVWQYGENFFIWSDLVIDYMVDSLEDMAENLDGSSLVAKEQSKQPQQLEQPQDDGVCPADSDTLSVGGVSPEDGKEQSKQPQQLGDLENKRKFAEHILIQDKLGLLEELHNLLDNKIGKYVAMTIRAAVEVGVMSRPYFPEVKAEFVEVGNKSGYIAYYNKVEAYDKNDFEYVKEKLLKYKKVEN